MTKIVSVDLQERSYPIWIGTDELKENLSEAIKRLTPVTHAFVLWDEHLGVVADQLRAKLTAKEIRTSCLSIPSGESSKGVEPLARIWTEMLAARSDRKTVVFAIGGGVVGDLAGFAAATFMRGVRFVQVPTTLLAMVDSSVGGKTGINLPDAKNIVGAFWQPHGVLIDTALLDSLPDREYLSGMAEIVKYGIILDPELFDFIESNTSNILARDPACLRRLIQRSCELKAHVVTNDERETTGLRAILNYGHTFGHAIEAVARYGTYLHGEAISIGMSMAGSLASQRGLWSDRELARQTKLLETLQLPTRCHTPLDVNDLVSAMQSDKKNEHGVLTLILPTRIGEVKSVRDVELAAITEVLREDPR